MKKILLLLLLACSLGVKAGEPTEDYVYATELRWDASMNKHYFEVILEGVNLYCGYGMDIQLPEGMTFSAAGRTTKTPEIDMAPQPDDSNVTIYKDEYGPTEHTLSKSFPKADDLSHARVACFSGENIYFGTTSGALIKAYVNISYVDKAWPIGSIKIYNVELNKVGQPYDAKNTDNAVLLHSGETTVPFNISAAANWSTCVLPFAASIPEGVTAYTYSKYDEQYLYLESAETLEAYKPYVLYKEGGYSGTITGNVEETIPSTNGVVTDGPLCGALTPQSVTEGYVLQNLSEGVKFYKIGDNATFSIPAGKCWVSIPQEANIKSFAFAVEETTAIEDAKAANNSEDIYTLQGVKVTKMLPGQIYVKGGKTILNLK